MNELIKLMKESHWDDVLIAILIGAAAGMAYHRYLQIKEIRQRIKINDAQLATLGIK